MAFTDFAKEARKLAPTKRIGDYIPTKEDHIRANAQIIDAQSTTGYIGTGYSSSRPKQAADERHCNIIKNVINEAQGSDAYSRANWENCRYMKSEGGRVFCKEYLSLCGKDRCSRARR